MKKIFVSIMFLFVLVQLSNAQSNIVIEDAWVREAPPGSTVTAAYMTIKNNADQSDKLISISSDSAQSLEIHITKVDKDGVATMNRIEVLELAKGEKAELIPGGMHLMLIGLNESIDGKDSISLKLAFENSADLEIDVPVKSMKDDGGHHHH